MKTHISIKIGVLLFFGIGSSLSQPASPNVLEGLYTLEAMERLNREIRLRNEAFNQELSDGALFPIPQGTAFYLSVDGVKARQVKEILALNPTYEEIDPMLSATEKKDSIYFFKVLRNEKVFFQPLSLKTEDNLRAVETAQAGLFQNNLSGQWVCQYTQPSSYTKENLRALFVYQEAENSPLPFHAAQCLRYVDHMVDTNQKILTIDPNQAKPFDIGINPKIEAFMRLTYAFPGRPEMNWDVDREDSTFQVFQEEFAVWNQLRENYVKNQLARTDRFKNLLNAAYQETKSCDTVKHFSYMDEFEDYVEKYISASEVLALKRKRVVFGRCSMDDSPIRHAINIARLAGETCCMDIFLRSHLDIVFDKFDRMTDASYAEPGRLTYVEELELLETKLELLLPGTLLASRNVSDNHYSGQVGRAARAIAELKDRTGVYENIHQLIDDDQLDFYNPVMLIVMAQHYNRYLRQKNLVDEVGNNKDRLMVSISRLPDYIRIPLKDQLNRL